jgi:hypothetical protein
MGVWRRELTSGGEAGGGSALFRGGQRREAWLAGATNGEDETGSTFSIPTKTFLFWVCDGGCRLSHARYLDASIFLLSYFPTATKRASTDLSLMVCLYIF